MLGFVAGATEWFDCDIDKKPSDSNYGLSGLARSWRISGGLVGITMNNADSGSNGQPTHPFAGRMSYPVINARHTIDGRLIVRYLAAGDGNKYHTWGSKYSTMLK